MARPKGKFDLPRLWFKPVLELYEVGASDVEIKSHIWEQRGSFSNDLWDRWLKEEVKFSETIKRGRLLSQAWWERKGRQNIGDKTFNATLWYMNMKNRFGWRDNHDITTDGDKIENHLTVYMPEEDEE